MSDEKNSGEMEIPVDMPGLDAGVTPADSSAKSAAEVAKEEDDSSRDIFDLGLDTRNSFRMLRKSVRHYIAHEEYGVLFSFCGVRITKKNVDYNPPARESDQRCEKCKQHIWQIVATTRYAEQMKKKKDLDD